MPDSSARRLEELVVLAKAVGLGTNQAQLELLEEGIGYLEDYLRRIQANRGLESDPAKFLKLLQGNL